MLWRCIKMHVSEWPLALEAVFPGPYPSEDLVTLWLSG
jgi:hypothetical protein